jgi:hypothetical protein
LLGLALAELALFLALAILVLNGSVLAYADVAPAARLACGVDSCFDRSRLLLVGLAEFYILAMVAPLLFELLLLAAGGRRGRVFGTVLQILQLVAVSPLLVTDYRLLVPLGAVLPIGFLLAMRWVDLDQPSSGVKSVS